MTDIKQNTKKLLRFVSEKFETDHLDNDSLVQLIELAADYLNLQTVSDYARTYKMSYNGVKNHRNIVTIKNVKFVFDNK